MRLSQCCCPKQPLPVHRPMEVRIQPSGPLPDFPAPKCSRLKDKIRCGKKPAIVRLDPVARPGLLALLVHVPAISIYQTALAILGEVFGYNGNSASFVDVIRVQPTKEISTSFGKSLIDSLRLTLICFTDPISNPLFVLAHFFFFKQKTAYEITR